MPDTNFENIELYLNNELSADERKEFETKLETDKQLQEQLQTYKEINNILIRRIDALENEQDLRKILSRKQAEYFTTEPKVVPINKHRNTRWLYTAVAAAAILILLLWSPWQQNILSNYGHVKMTNPTVRGNGQNHRMTDAARLFNNGKYKDAFPLLDSAVHADPANAQHLFYRGVTLLHLKEETKAQQDLKAVFDGQSIYQYEAAYFMAISYLKKGHKDSCRIWLQKIPKDAAIYHSANKLLDKVNR